MIGPYLLHPSRIPHRVVTALVCLSLVSSCAPAYGPNTRQSAQVGFGVSASYSELDGWGSWGVHAQYGDVWYPYVDHGWAPFTYGNWVWTHDGWMWSAYEPYGWLVFHYGNWYYDDMNGWFWIPGTSYSPAPVNWYVYDTYVCWAPRPPAGTAWPTPWQARASFAWTVVAASDFTSENVGDRRMTRIQQPSGGGHRGVARRSPDIQFVVKDAREKPQRQQVQREMKSMQNKTYIKMRLPDEEQKKVQKHQNRFQKNKRAQQDPKSKAREREKNEKGKGRGRSGAS